MKDVLQEILTTEKEAEKIVRDARDKASRMIRETDAGINEEKIRLKEDIRVSLQKKINDAAESVYRNSETDTTEDQDFPEEKYQHVRNEIMGIICQTSIKEE